MIRRWPALLLFLLPAAGAPAGPADDGRWYTGGYSFSDELGGFRILSVAGSGTRADPIVVVQQLHSASPATLTIRSARPLNPTGKAGEWATGMMHVSIVVVNASGLPWIGFSFELQEVLGKPSVFGDGLSFDQRKLDSESVGMDRFARFERQFEPYDRLDFLGGHVDPADEVGFRFFISDFTPRTRFYLLQDPQIPSS